MTFRDRLIQLAEEIVSLRAALRAKEKEMDQLLPHGELPELQAFKKRTGAFIPEPVVPQTDATLTDRVLRFFSGQQPNEAIGPHALRGSLGLEATQEKSLRATLGRLAAEGKIRRISRGKYAANVAEKGTT